MKIIFLDIDGVLNSTGSYLYYMRNEKNETESLCPIAVSNLNYIMEKTSTDVFIVISSCWRHFYNIELLRKIFKKQGFLFEEHIIDYTPTNMDRNDVRGEEIQRWLDGHKDVEKYAIIDDTDDMLESQMKNFFKTNPQDGLVYSVTRDIIMHFNKDAKVFYGSV